MVEDQKLVEFDCKAWNVPNENDMFAWCLYRQNDCIKNSKQQAAQTYLSYKELLNLNTDEQIRLLKERKGIDWEKDYSDGKKYGRFIYKKEVKQANEELDLTYIRNVWIEHDAFILNDENNRDRFLTIIKNS